uniref:Uncharacterized protein n=1 Tax=Anguilla anguilla TaxID=7936 RepID=A0A0E9PTE4_ANGAN
MFLKRMFLKSTLEIHTPATTDLRFLS